MRFRRWLPALLALAMLFSGTPGRAADPVLAVFPFAVSGSIPPSTGVQLAASIADEIKALGGVTVVKGDPATAPADYHEAAKAAGADLYLTGAISRSPFGTGFSVIEQILRAKTGVQLWSYNVQLTDIAAAKGEGARIHDVIATPGPPSGATAEATPAPSPSPAAVPLANASTGRTGPAPAGGPGATPPPAAVPETVAALLAQAPAGPRPPPLNTPPPAAAAVILPVTGSAGAGDRVFAARALVEAVGRHGSTAALWTQPLTGDAQAAELQLCSATQAQTLLAASLDTTHVVSVTDPPHNTAHLALNVYDCRTHALAPKPVTADQAAAVGTDAIRAAADAAVTALLGTPVPGT